MGCQDRSPPRRGAGCGQGGRSENPACGPLASSPVPPVPVPFVHSEGTLASSPVLPALVPFVHSEGTLARWCVGVPVAVGVCCGC